LKQISAFVGHSFNEADSHLIRKFTDYFDSLKDLEFGFDWTHAEPAKPMELSEKVYERMQGRNLFIGICTSHETAIRPMDLRRLPLTDIFFGRRNSFVSKSSDWIIQEIGFACGRGMDIILLLEEEVRRPGGLQGDIEYIQFTRSEPEKSFLKLVQMIKALGSETEDLSLTSAKQSASPVEIPSGEVEPVQQPDKTELLTQIYQAVKDKDPEREENLSQQYIQLSGNNKDDQISLEARRLYYHQSLNKVNNFAELEQLTKDNPSHSLVFFILAVVYDDYKDPENAAKNYQISATLTEDLDARVYRLCQAMERYAQAKSKQWETVLNSAIKEVNDSPSRKSTILASLSNIYKEQEKWSLFFSTAEAALKANPENHRLRFQLAYQYSQNTVNSFSYHHYRVLVKVNPNETNWNNLGVAADRLGMNIKSISAYRESEKLGGTLAMSNIAKNFTSVGFRPEAEEIINRALQIPNYDTQIGGAISNLRDEIEEEISKETKTLEETEMGRVFLVSFSESSLEQTTLNAAAVYQGKDYLLNVKISENSLVASASYDRPKPTVTFQKQANPEYDKVTIDLSGKMAGRSCSYKKTVFENGKETLTSEGLLLLSKDLGELQILDGKLIDKPSIESFSKTNLSLP